MTKAGVLNKDSGFLLSRSPVETNVCAVTGNCLLFPLQSQPGIEPVCDACRGCDTRAPQNMPPMQVLLAEFVRDHGVG